MFNNIFFASVLISLLLIPLAYEDYRHRNIGLWPSVAVAALCLILGAILTWAGYGLTNIEIIALGVVLVGIASKMKWIEKLDVLLIVSCMIATSFIGVFAYLLSLLVLVFVGLIKGKERRRALPVITVYLCCIVFVFFLYLGIVALRL